MEKIQSAIAKARATREGRIPAETGPGPPCPQAPQPDGLRHPGTPPWRPRRTVPARGPARRPAADAAWEALPLLKPDAGLMQRNRIVAFEAAARRRPST